jgi:hypothetical protein
MWLGRVIRIRTQTWGFGVWSRWHSGRAGGTINGVTPVQFELSRRFEVPVRTLWDELVDWPAHGAWIPATSIEGGPGDPTEVGYTFTAWTGIRPLALEDRMRVTRCDWDDGAQVGVCDVEKLGPVLGGAAGFTVRADGVGSAIEWREDVTVPYLGRIGFRLALRSLAKVLARR